MSVEIVVRVGDDGAVTVVAPGEPPIRIVAIDAERAAAVGQRVEELVGLAWMRIRAARADPDEIVRVLAQAPDVPPAPEDEMPSEEGYDPAAIRRLGMQILYSVEDGPGTGRRVTVTATVMRGTARSTVLVERDRHEAALLYEKREHGSETEGLGALVEDAMRAGIERLQPFRAKRRPDGHIVHDGNEWIVQRDAGESDDEYEARRRLVLDGLQPKRSHDVSR